MSTEISWTDETWNPTVGCSRVSPGCDHCYAIRVAQREMQPAHVGLTIRGRSTVDPRPTLPDWTGEVRCLPDRLDTPLRWRKPRRVFVDSMSDLFHPEVPREFIGQVFGTMCGAEQHTFQVLTKRPQRMAKLLGDWERVNWTWRRSDGLWCGPIAGPLPNVWLGTSVENQRYADLRIPHLLATPAAVRFLSMEPLLGPVNMLPWLRRGKRVDWVIIGGESGPGARPMELEWAQDIVDVCRQYGVAVFVKQLGTVAGGKHHQDIETFPAGLRVREFPA